MKSHLYIGGAMDGKYLPSPAVLGALSGVLDNDLYIRDTLTIGSASITIYRHESLTSEQALDCIVDYLALLYGLHRWRCDPRIEFSECSFDRGR